MKSFSHYQDWFLYNAKWTETLDGYLIRRLIEREKECHSIPPVDSPHALICAMEALNKELGADRRYVDVLERVHFLGERYTCFKKLASRMETVWDAINNRIEADEVVWEVIFRAEPLAQAYYIKGDPHWYQLCRLFGWNDIKNEASPTVIVISETPNALYSCPSASPDEVTSPLLKPPTARKLLFEDDAHSSIGPSNPTAPNLQYTLDFGGIGNGIEHSSRASSSPHNGI